MVCKTFVWDIDRDEIELWVIPDLQINTALMAAVGNLEACQPRLKLEGTCFYRILKNIN